MSSTIEKLPKNLTNSVAIKNGSVLELYTELKASGKKHIYVDGAKTIQGFLNVGLITEIIITKIPVLIGSGIPLFGNLENDVNLKLMASKGYENGFVQSKYKVIN